MLSVSSCSQWEPSDESDSCHPAGLQIIPVNYRLGGGHRLFVKIAPRGALAQLAEADAQVAFEVDYHAADFQIAWSVLMNGTIGIAIRMISGRRVKAPFVE